MEEEKLYSHDIKPHPNQWIVLPPGCLRIILAYIVFFSHTVPLQLGYCAVLLFFMLSGYWVYQMWKLEYISTKNPVLTFIISRFWRILPIYYLALIFICFVKYSLVSDRFPIQPGFSFNKMHVYLSHIFILGYAPLSDSQRISGVVWSLDIELQFYLVAPILIIMLEQRYKKYTMVTLWTIALIGLFYGITFYHLKSTHAFLPMYLWAFLVGLQTARTGWRPGVFLSTSLACFALAAIVVCIAIPATRPLLSMGSFSSWLSDYNEVANLFLAICFIPYAMATVHRSLRIGHFLTRIDRDLSNITYEIYLFQVGFVMIIDHVIGSDSKFHHIFLIVGNWLIIFPAAYMVYLLVDRPIDRRRRLFVRTRRFSMTPVAASLQKEQFGNRT